MLQAKDWKEIKRRGYLEVDGVRHPLDHLQDRRFRQVIEASGNAPRLEFTVLVQYSSHVVSIGPRHGLRLDFARLGRDREIIDDGGRSRCFCEDRYRFTDKLPAIIESLPERMCFFTGRENWLTVEITTTSGEREEYEVFFRVTRQSGKMLRIYVESAYVRDEFASDKRPMKRVKRDKVKGVTLLAKKLRGEPIRRPPRR